MGFWNTLITSLGIIIFSPIFSSILWYFKLREEKKRPTNYANIVRTSLPKSVAIFFLGTCLFFLFAGIVAIICVWLTIGDLISILILSAFTALLFGIGFIGFFIEQFSYVVADEKGLTAHYPFRKIKFYPYEEITYFKDRTSYGMLGLLTCYNISEKVIISVKAMQIGVNDVIKLLREHGIKEMDKT